MNTEKKPEDLLQRTRRNAKEIAKIAEIAKSEKQTLPLIDTDRKKRKGLPRICADDRGSEKQNL
jgi:hypothetical protein